MDPSFYEDLRRSAEVQKASSRSLGLVMAAVSAGAGVWPVRNGQPVRLWLVTLAALFGLIALLRPRMLDRLNSALAWIGWILGRVASLLALAILYFAVFTPVAVIRRILRKDALGRYFEPEAATYWVSRIPPDSDLRTMERQF